MSDLKTAAEALLYVIGTPYSQKEYTDAVDALRAAVTADGDPSVVAAVAPEPAAVEEPEPVAETPAEPVAETPEPVVESAPVDPPVAASSTESSTPSDSTDEAAAK